MARSPTGPLTADTAIAAGASGLARSATQVASLSVVGLCFVWSYWTTLATMAERWSTDPQYSHGFLVPVFAAVILWHRRERVPRRLAPNWWGLVVLLVALGLRLTGAYLYFEPLDAFSVVPATAGLCLLLGGWSALGWMWPAIAFLSFMLPLPFQIEMALAQPLRRLATLASTYALQTLGYPALAEGNIIFIDEVRLGIVDACSGLGMLMTFFALSTAVAIIIQRRWLDKVLIVVSAVPIAVIANVIRITATGVAHSSYGPESGQFLHDWAGWLMMPLALGLLWLELQFLNRLLVEVETGAPLPIDFALGGEPAPRARREPLLSRAAKDPPSAPMPQAVSSHLGDSHP
jgi:exosortase